MSTYDHDDQVQHYFAFSFFQLLDIKGKDSSGYHNGKH